MADQIVVSSARQSRHRKSFIVVRLLYFDRSLDFYVSLSTAWRMIFRAEARNLEVE